MKKMRRGDREITDFAEILEVLKKADTIRLGLNGAPYPYVVPLSFGFEALYGGAGGSVNGAGGANGSANGGANDGGDEADEAPRVAVYVHGATEGLKHDLIARDNHVCVEADISHSFVRRDDEGGSSVTTSYESVIGFGSAKIVTGAEAEHGMALMLEHCGCPDFKYNKADLDTVIIYKFTLTQITGKRNL